LDGTLYVDLAPRSPWSQEKLDMRLVTRSALILAALISTASAAEAATTDANSSRGTADLSWSTRKGITGPTSDKLGGSTLQVQFSADLDPVADTTKPLLAVAMKQAVLQASWHDDKTIDLSPVDSTTQDGAVKVQHTLAPHIKLFIDAFGFNLTYDYNAQALMQKLPGSSWAYEGVGSGTFLPWATTNYGIVKVVAPALENALIVSTPLEDLIGGGSNPVLTGTLGFAATTAPTFNYATKEITVANGTPITKETKSWTVPTTDADFLDVPTAVKGEITYSGSLFGRPSISITKIGSYKLPFALSFDIDALGTELPYSSDTAPNTPIAVEFPAQMIHIPLPNVKATNTLDIGSANVGERVSKPSTIKNTGELEAVLSIKSSDPQFKASASDKVMKAKDTFALDIEFTPKAEGPQSADITVTSNDPNEPVQIIHVTGNGTVEPAPTGPDDGAEEYEPRTDSGCGCRTAPAPSGYAGVGLVGLALAAILRRRRA
jgi:MYXO-CTERM domain-containing protein